MGNPYPSIREKVVLLTGSTGPMGRILVDAFLDAGAKLALCVRRMANLPQLEQSLADRGESPMIVPCDVRYEENIVRMIHRVVQRFGRIDAIVNVAAILGPKLKIIDYPADPWRDVISTNVTGAYLICREALPWMVRQNSGSIIHVTTSLTANVKPEWGAYLVGNHAIEGLTKLLATELKGTGVRVNSVDVGMMNADLKPVGPNNDWTKVFLWLVSDESSGQSGERISASSFE
ncbi:MAG: SDR family oxidoreductase [Planctomycetes bacterium]|nr:SDR family oxidoreductase [Planctomycetota bacterium]